MLASHRVRFYPLVLLRVLGGQKRTEVVPRSSRFVLIVDEAFFLISDIREQGHVTALRFLFSTLYSKEQE